MWDPQHLTNLWPPRPITGIVSLYFLSFWGNNRCLFWESYSYKRQIRDVGEMYILCLLSYSVLTIFLALTGRNNVSCVCAANLHARPIPLCCVCPSKQKTKTSLRFHTWSAFIPAHFPFRVLKVRAMFICQLIPFCPFSAFYSSL
jgi:hypothetical protein